MTKKLYIVILAAFLLPAALFGAPVEAEYLRIKKEYTLNADGSQEKRVYMELTLFTHTAMNSTYGESFIVYDPMWQELKIHSSYTKMKDGKIIQTPENAFVEVLPRAAANAPAYNRLIEMVVVHTGLELGATIYLDYSITSKPGYLNQIDIFEPILQSSPVKDMEISVSVPAGKSLNYYLQKVSVRLKIATSDGMTTYSWSLRDLPASSRSYQVNIENQDVPYFAANSYDGFQDLENEITNLFFFHRDILPELTELVEDLTGGYSSDTEKLKAIHSFVVDGIASSPLRYADISFRPRGPLEVIRTGYGTTSEKYNLLGLLLALAHIEVLPVVVFNVDAPENVLGMNAVEGFYVYAQADGKDYYMAPSSYQPAKPLLAADIYPSYIIGEGRIDHIGMPVTNCYDIRITVDPDGGAEYHMNADISDALCSYRGKGNEQYVFGKPVTGTDKDEYEGNCVTEKAGDYIVLHLPGSQAGMSSVPVTSLNSARDYNLLLPYAYDESYTYSIRLPRGTEFRSADLEKNIVNPAGRMSVAVSEEDGMLVIDKSIRIDNKMITPANYKHFRELATAWNSDSASRIILKK